MLCVESLAEATGVRKVYYLGLYTLGRWTGQRGESQQLPESGHLGLAKSNIGSDLCLAPTWALPVPEAFKSASLGLRHPWPASPLHSTALKSQCL